MTASSAAIRAFLAVQVDPAIHTALVRLRDELAALKADVRWVRPEGLHATLKFLGRVAADRLDAIRAALGPVGARHAVCLVRVRGMGVFPTPTRPRIVWVGLEGDGLGALAAAIEEAVEPFGFSREGRPFHPHITLGRVKGPRGWPRVAKALHAHGNDDFGSCAIGELIAYRSDLRSGGAVYTKLWTVLLAGSRGGSPSCH